MSRATDQTLAREALDALRNCKSVRLSVRGGRTVEVPDSALDSFLATLEAVADGVNVDFDVWRIRHPLATIRRIRSRLTSTP